MTNDPFFKLFIVVPILVFPFTETHSAKKTKTMAFNMSIDTELASAIPDALKKQALQTLREVMNTQEEWVKVHAAEFLIWSGNAEGVKEAFLNEEKIFGNKSQYRIGIARVLAQTAQSESEKKGYTDKIMEAFLNVNGTDRIHAVETLAKLKISPARLNAEVTREALVSATQSLAMYTKWSVAFTSQDSLQSTKEEMLELLSSGKMDAAAENQAAYILRNLGNLTVSEWTILAKAILAKSKPNVYQYSAALVTAPHAVSGSVELKQIYEQLLKFSNYPSKGERMELCMALSLSGTKEDLPVLVALLNSENPLSSESDNADVQAAAAYAILKNAP